MAEQGWTDEEITQLQNEVNLARAEANKLAAEMGLTRAQGQYMETKAVDKALEEAHDRFHAKLNAAMAQIEYMGAKKLPVAAHAHSSLGPAERDKMKKLLEG